MKSARDRLIVFETVGGAAFRCAYDDNPRRSIEEFTTFSRMHIVET
jgi:hypothetical protein